MNPEKEFWELVELVEVWKERGMDQSKVVATLLTVVANFAARQNEIGVRAVHEVLDSIIQKVREKKEQKQKS